MKFKEVPAPKIVKEKKGRMSNRMILLIAAAICAVLLLAMWGVPALIRKLSAKEPADTKEYKFYPIDESEDIMKDQTYLSLDRNFYYEDPSQGITYSFSPDELKEIPDENRLPVELLVRYIRYAIAGEEEGLNDLCSKKYLASGFSLKEEFTPQKIYDIKFTFVMTDMLQEDKNSWQRWQFWVEYKIRRNNGTFRNDMDSDCSRKELFEITYRDGKVEIDGIAPYRVVN